jgi:streptogramin lyase/DNA-directed RNA polymerase subunit RPC12/RpoP
MPTSFKCPTCAAPLDVQPGAGVTMRCPYCENTVILPEELRGGAGIHNHGVGQSAGASFGPMIDQALKMAEVAQLLRAGNKIAAIKLYRETFGVGLQEAKNAVEKIERGEPITLTQARMEAAHDRYGTPSSAHPQLMSGAALNQKKAGGGRCLILGLVLIVVITGAFILFGGGAYYLASRQTQTSAPTGRGGATGKPAPNGYANVALEFGSEGIGAGQFKDARSIAVDGEGRIYTAEYIGGRLQVFDVQGRFLTQWMVDPKRPLSGMAADRQGTLYIVQGGSIIRYKGATGERLGELESRGPGFNQNYSSVFVALDGSLYAIAASYNIVHIGTDGRIKTIIDAREKTGEYLHLEGLAVSGNGHIYALDRSEESVFKFGPDGKFINRFGGEGTGAGQLRSPDGIGVDGQGRVYVCDVGRGIQVFDSNGRFLDSFAPGEVIFEIAINDRNEIFASQRNLHKIVKYVLVKP